MASALAAGLLHFKKTNSTLHLQNRIEILASNFNVFETQNDIKNEADIHKNGFQNALNF